jgi:hypothetical protein
MSANYDNDTTIIVSIPENTSTQERTTNLIIRAANKPFYDLDLEKDIYEEVKVLIRQKGVKRNTENVDFIYFHNKLRFINEQGQITERGRGNAYENLMIYVRDGEDGPREDNYYYIKGKITTEHVGKGIQVSAVRTLTNSTEEVNQTISFTIPDLTGNEFSEITNLSVKIINTTSDSQYPTPEILEVTATSVPCTGTYSDHGYWQAKYTTEGENTFTVNNFQSWVGNPWSWAPINDNYIGVDIEFKK